MHIWQKWELLNTTQIPNGNLSKYSFIISSKLTLPT